jgi:hypothetical protein
MVNLRESTASLVRSGSAVLPNVASSPVPTHGWRDSVDGFRYQ